MLRDRVPQINYNNKNMLMGAMIIAGWDKKHGGQVHISSSYLSAYLTAEARWLRL